MRFLFIHQRQVFSVEKHKDETELMDKHGAIDFNNHQDVFYSLYSKVPIKNACIVKERVLLYE